MKQEVKSPLIRICLFTGSYTPVVGGGERHAQYLAQYFSDSGCPTTVLTRRVIAESPREESNGNLSIKRVKPSGPSRYGKYLMLIPSVIWLIFNRHQYDIVYVNIYRAIGIAAVPVCKLLGKPVVLKSGNVGELSGSSILEQYENSGKKLKHFLIKAFFKFRNWIIKRCDSFVCISTVLEDDLIECNVPTRKIAKIHNGVDTNHFHPVTPDRKEALKRGLGLSGKTIFAYSGKLNRGKGLEHLIQAWPKLISKYPDIHLMLIGSGGGQTISCEAEIRESVIAHNLQSYVTFTGYVSDVGKHLQASDIFILPSRSEGLGNSLIEGMACGLACIGAANSGMLDVIEDKKNGLLFEYGNEESLMRALEYYLDNPEKAEAFATAGLKTINEKFSMRQMGEKHLTLFRSLLANNA